MNKSTSNSQTFVSRGIIKDGLLIHHNKLLSAKRSLAFSGGTASKVIVLLLAVFGLAYLAFLGTVFGWLVHGDNGTSGFEFIGGIMPIVMAIDLMLRFGLRQTPSQLVKPYLLLPISKYTVTKVFLIEDLLSPFNLIWQAMFIPFTLIAIVPHYGFISLVQVIVIVQLLVLINSQWYLLVRSLTSISSLWWILPIVVYGAMLLPLFGSKGIDAIAFLEFYAGVGKWLSVHQTTLWIIVFAVLLLVFAANLFVQQYAIRFEMEHLRQSSKGSRFSISFLRAKSEVGMFMQLELAGMFRNKYLRNNLLSYIVAVIAFSAILALSNLSDDLSYIYLSMTGVLFSLTFWIKIMCNEGNYIDCLMVHKDSIKSLLTAKLWISVCAIFFQFIVFIPTIIMGKSTFGDVLANFILGGGFGCFVCFQLAVYNNQTQNFNAKLVGKGASLNKTVQILTVFATLFISEILTAVLQELLGKSVGNIVLCAIGLILILTNRLWINNIVKRMMARKYKNLEGFRTSRVSQ